MSIAADNPRKREKTCKLESKVLLKTRHYVVGQFNGHLKSNVLGGVGLGLRGLV